MKKILILNIIFAALTISLYGCKDSSGPTTPSNPPGGDTTNGYKLVWSDEFNYEGLPDTSKWLCEVGGSGWGNHELQYYTEARKENANVTGGMLIITARKEQWEGMNYTSARLNSKNAGHWLYGRMEIRAVVPSGRGTWPAIWMLYSDNNYGNNGWPDNGEIDIMEHVGYDPGVIHGSIHCNKYNWRTAAQKTTTINVSDCTTNYHVYAMEWTPEKIDLYVDSTKYFTFANENTGWEAWPFNHRLHMILNVAVGGDWGGAQGVDDTIFPQRMLIDYVRVYQKD